MMAIAAAALIYACLVLLKLAAVPLVDALATAIAAIYRWRARRLRIAIRTAGSGRRVRRLLAQHLKLSVDMTAHFSLFPRSACRGYQLADAISRRI